MLAAVTYEPKKKKNSFQIEDESFNIDRSIAMERAHSNSTSAATVTHSVLDLVADFERKVLEGSVQITVRVSDGATALRVPTKAAAAIPWRLRRPPPPRRTGRPMRVRA